MTTARILIPPGIGDIYWVLVKLRAFLKSKGIDRAELTMVTDPHEHDSHLRALPYLQMFDWFDVSDIVTVPNDRQNVDIWQEAYLGPGRSIFENVQGYDYFLCYNGRINSGGFIETDELACEWQPQMSPIAEKVINQYAAEYASLPSYFKDRPGQGYMVLFWPFYGDHLHTLADFSIKEIAEVLNAFRDRTRLIPIFIGAAFDKIYNTALQDLVDLVPCSCNWTGELTLHETLGLIKSAGMVTGYHSGITNLAAAMGVKTCLLWGDRYPSTTSWAVVPPDSRGTNYLALESVGLAAETYFYTLAGLYGGPFIEKISPRPGDPWYKDPAIEGV